VVVIPIITRTAEFNAEQDGEASLMWPPVSIRDIFRINNKHIHHECDYKPYRMDIDVMSL